MKIRHKICSFIIFVETYKRKSQPLVSGVID